MPKDNKDLTEIVAEILIEMHQMKEVQSAQTSELHFHREQLEKIDDRLEKIDDRLEKADKRLEENQQTNMQMFNTFANAVLDRLDSIKGEMKNVNQKLDTVVIRQNLIENQLDTDILKRLDNLEKTVYGKAS